MASCTGLARLEPILWSAEAPLQSWLPPCEEPQRDYSLVMPSCAASSSVSSAARAPVMCHFGPLGNRHLGPLSKSRQCSTHQVPIAEHESCRGIGAHPMLLFLPVVIAEGCALPLRQLLQGSWHVSISWQPYLLGQNPQCNLSCLPYPLILLLVCMGALDFSAVIRQTSQRSLDI